MKKMTLCKLLAVLLGAAVMNTVAASGSGTATLSNLHYTLIDLDTNDGITPSINFSNAGYIVSPSTAFAYGNDGDGVKSKMDKANAPLIPVSTTLSGAQYNLTASVTGANTLESTVLSTALQTGSDNKSRFDYDATASSGTLRFTLSPHTAIAFYADVSLSAASSGLLPGVGSNGVLSVASLSASFGGQGAPYSFFDVSARASVNHTAGEAGAEMPITDTKTQTLEFTYSNVLDMGVRGYVYANIGVYTSQEPPYITIPDPVPEPESYAMLLAGLGLVGALALRRKNLA